MLQALPATLAAAQVPAWKLLPAVVGCASLVYAATFITRVEKRLPLVYYKQRMKVGHTAPSSPEPDVLDISRQSHSYCPQVAGTKAVPA